MELNLSSQFDVVSEVNVDYDLVSHVEVQLTGENGLYDAVVASTVKGQRVLFSGKAVVGNFRNLAAKYGNPYATPVRLQVEMAKTKAGKEYKLINRAFTL